MDGFEVALWNGEDHRVAVSFPTKAWAEGRVSRELTTVL